MDPTVSIITPTFNHEKYIDACIKSVLAQTYASWEMIIIDDGSTDSTPQKIAEHSDKRIRYVRQEHQGRSKLGATYNHALSISKGEYIAILEGDDFWSMDKLEKQVTSFEDASIVLSVSNYYIAYDSGSSLKCVLPKVISLYPALTNKPLAHALYPLLEGLSPGSVTLMFRKATLLGIGGFQQLFDLPYVDYPTLLAMTLKGHFAYVPEDLGYFRRHKRSISSSSLENQRHTLEMKRKKYEYCTDFLRQNCDKIATLGLSVADLNRINKVRRDNEIYLMHLTNGQELYKMGNLTGSRETYRQLIRQNAPLKYKLVSCIGILSTYCCRVDIFDTITALYTKVRRFRFK